MTAVLEQQIHPENSALERQHGDFILVEDRTEELSLFYVEFLLTPNCKVCWNCTLMCTLFYVGGLYMD